MSNSAIVQPLGLDSPAIVGAARTAALSAIQRYRDLGVDDWATEQAEKDAKASVRALEVFFQVQRLSWTPSQDEVTSLQLFYKDLWLAGLFVPLFKWCTAMPLAEMSGFKEAGRVFFRETPPPPTWVTQIPTTPHPIRCIFPYPIGPMKVLRTRLSECTASGQPTRRARNLAWSLQGAKAMFPSLWVDKVASALQDHAINLSKTAPLLTDIDSQWLDIVGESIARLAFSQPAPPVPGRSRPTRQFKTYGQLPRPRLSASAGWVKLYDKDARRIRTMAGTRSAVHERISPGLGLGRELYSMDYRPTAGVRQFHQIPYQFNWRDWDFAPRVSIVALQEPFKIRTISIADGPSTAAAAPIQSALHSSMRQLAPFQLIGGTRVADSIARDIKDLQPNHGWVSGDYSAATDKLSSRASKRVYDRLLSRLALDPLLRQRITTGLFSAELDYSRTLDPFKGKVPDELLESIPLPDLTQQSNGQLMGNILSFPILCLVNLAGYLSAMYRARHTESFGTGAPYDGLGTDPLGNALREGWHRGYLTRDELDSLPVLINGDDILFQATPPEYSVWRSVVLGFGLEPSVGKNYYSNQFFTVNSELYTADGFQSRPWWGAFETELVRLRNEIKFETGEDVLSADLRQVLPKMQEFLRETVSPTSWEIVNPIWLQHINRHGLLDPYKGLNWFVPVDLGGMGLDGAGWNSRDMTYAQRKLMARASLDPNGLARFRTGIQGSLLTDESTRELRSMLDKWWLKGSYVRTEDGRSFVLDKSQETANPGETDQEQDGVPFLRAYETVASVLTRSAHIDSWLDYHVNGVRLDVDRVRKNVTAALHWGLRLSDKHLVDGDVEVDPRYECVRRVSHLTCADGAYSLA